MTGVMVHRTLSLALMGALAAVAAAARPRAQSDPYAKLIGTWAVDSMNGADDNGLPKSQTIAFSRSGTLIRVTLTTDDGTGPTSLVVNCSSATGGAMRDLGSGQSARCTLRPLADSVMYTLQVRKGIQIIASEHGRLVVSNAGTTLRDDYVATRGAKVVATPSGAALRDTPDLTSATGEVGYYRHVYRKQQ